MNETNNIKIIVFTGAAIGHTNPMSCILHEIVESKQASDLLRNGADTSFDRKKQVLSAENSSTQECKN